MSDSIILGSKLNGPAAHKSKQEDNNSPSEGHGIFDQMQKTDSEGAVSSSCGGNMVNHPSHYNQGNIECIDAIVAAKGWYETTVFCEINAFKYNWRLGNKDSVPQELGKMSWYTQKAKELFEKALNWFYPKNKHYYAIIKKIRAKNPDTGEWFDAVLYTDGKGTYARELHDFFNKFQPKE